MKLIRPVVCSYSDKDGGAARAAFGHHKALLLQGIPSEMIVAIKKSDMPTIHGPQKKIQKGMVHFRRELSHWITGFQKTPNKNLHSLQMFPSIYKNRLNKSNYDVVNLHWICSEFLSIEDIGKIKKPIVWTLHDMWPILGAEHYVSDESFTRAALGYKSYNRLEGQSGWDLDRWCWLRKKRSWKSPIQIIVSSEWMKNRVEKSDLMKGWPVTVIPNVIDLDKFRPLNKKIAREILGLPSDKKIIAFGATGGLDDVRKGGDLLISSLSIVNKSIKNLNIVIFGQSNPGNHLIEKNNSVHWLGQVNDDTVLSLIYNAADVIAIPSRQDNLPLTAAEAQSCGCPVVAFNATGLPDLVQHKTTGYLASPFSIDDLAYGIEWVLGSEERHCKLSNAARVRAKSLWSSENIVKQYLEVYQKAINQYGSSR